MSSPTTSIEPSASFDKLFAASARFWEPRRIAYNAILVGVCAAWLWFSWPHFRPALHLEFLWPLLALGLFANICYCAAYVVDLPLSSSAFRASWLNRRWILWFAGTLFAVLLANYWIVDEIFPDFH